MNEGLPSVLYDSANAGVTGSVTYPASTNPNDLWITDPDLQLCPSSINYNVANKGCSNTFMKQFPSGGGYRAFNLPKQNPDTITIEMWINQPSTLIADSNNPIIQASVATIVSYNNYYYCFTNPTPGGLNVRTTLTISNNIWYYVACGVTAGYMATVTNSAFNTNMYGTYQPTTSSTCYINYLSQTFYLRELRIWESMRTYNQLQSTKYLSITSHPNLLLYSKLSENSDSYDYITSQICSGSSSSYSTYYSEGFYPALVTSESVGNFPSPNTALLLPKGQAISMALTLPTKIWYFIRRAFTIRVWTKISGSLSDRISFFYNSEVMNAYIDTDLSLGLNLIDRITQNTISIKSNSYITQNQWYLITYVKNETDYFLFGVNNQGFRTPVYQQVKYVNITL